MARRRKIYSSWNGATGVARWDLLAGASAAALAPVGSVKRSGFETLGRVPGANAFAGARAVDASGKVLAVSAPVAVKRR